MAITEKMGVITQIDENGNEAILYPKTKAELVDGLEEKINEQLGGSGTGGGSADEATIDAKIAGHNTANDSHQDIRLMIKEHEGAVNALLNSDDETLNETKEIVAYIKSNKSLIDAITTSKVNVSDIINNLTTNVTDKPLSAAQGVALKALIDGLQSGKLNATDLTSAINTALAQAKERGEFNGTSPHIGENGNWFIGETDTGVKAQGDKGDQGERGLQGERGEEGGWFVYSTVTAIDTMENVSNLMYDPLAGDGALAGLWVLVNGKRCYVGGNYSESGMSLYTDATCSTRAIVSYAVGDLIYFIAKQETYEQATGDSTVRAMSQQATTVRFAETELELAKNGIVEPETMGSLSELEENGDKSKAYVLPDGNIYAYKGKDNTVLTADDFVVTNVLSNGELQNGTPRIASKNLLSLTDGTISIVCPAPYQYFVYYYSDNDTSSFIGKTAWKNNGISDVSADAVASGTLSGARYCRISFRDGTNTSASLAGRLDEFMANITVAVDRSAFASEWTNTGYRYTLSNNKTFEKIVESFGYENTQTGNPIHGEYMGETALKVKAYVEASQENGILVDGVVQDASPENVREISGLEGFSIAISGENPDSAETHHIELPEISYGGYVDFTRKKYVQTHHYKVINGDNCGTPSNGSVVVSVNSAYAIRYSVDVLCNRYKGTVYTSDDNVAFPTGELGLRVRDTTHFTDAETTVAFLNANPVMIVYQLKTPIEHDISNLPTILAFDGETTVSSNADSLEVTGYGKPNYVSNTLKGKTITCFGDSLAANCYVGKGKQWIERVGEYFECKKIYNRGVGGSAVSAINGKGNERNNYAAFNTDGEAYLRISYKTGEAPMTIPDGYVETKASMELDVRVNTIPLDTDILLIEAGTNDNDLDSDTLSEAYDRMLVKIQNRIPNAKIIILGLPFTNPKIYDSDEQREYFRNTLDELMVGIREVGKKYGIPIIELKDTAQVNLLNYTRYMSTDALHYDTEAGTKRWAEAVINGMKGLTFL